MATSSVIIGSGIIGLSTAYFLSLSPNTPASSIHLVDAASSLFAGASGYAAGFLANDWFDPAVNSLASLSFHLHQELARKNDGREKWGYCGSTGVVFTDEQALATGKENRRHLLQWWEDHRSRADSATKQELDPTLKGPSWLTVGSGDQVRVISDSNNSAQM